MEANVYSEIYSFIKFLGNEYINKLPQEEYKLIYKNRNKEYNPKYKLSDFKDDRKMLFETKVIILYFLVKYWCESEKEKNVIKQILINKK